MHPKSPHYQRIATEEAFAPPELLQAFRKIIAKGNVDPGFNGLMGFYMNSPSERAQHIMRCLTDMDELRIQHMDECGIDRQVLAMTSPGVQVMGKDDAVAFAISGNDFLADAVKRHPTRFTGMISVAPQDPQAAAREIERGVTKLGMNAVVINSHTNGEYLSDPKFWDIFAAAEAHDAPIYLHPNSLPKNMLEPFQECGLDGAIYGFGVETGLHLRLELGRVDFGRVEEERTRLVHRHHDLRRRLLIRVRAVFRQTDIHAVHLNHGQAGKHEEDKQKKDRVDHRNDLDPCFLHRRLLDMNPFFHKTY